MKQKQTSQLFCRNLYEVSCAKQKRLVFEEKPGEQPTTVDFDETESDIIKPNALIPEAVRRLNTLENKDYIKSTIEHATNDLVRYRNYYPTFDEQFASLMKSQERATDAADSHNEIFSQDFMMAMARVAWEIREGNDIPSALRDKLEIHAASAIRELRRLEAPFKEATPQQIKEELAPKITSILNRFEADIRDTTKEFLKNNSRAFASASPAGSGATPAPPHETPRAPAAPAAAPASAPAVPSATQETPKKSKEVLEKEEAERKVTITVAFINDGREYKGSKIQEKGKNNLVTTKGLETVVGVPGALEKDAKPEVKVKFLQALKKLQTEWGTTPDGIFGPESHIKLLAWATKEKKLDEVKAKLLNKTVAAPAPAPAVAVAAAPEAKPAEAPKPPKEETKEDKERRLKSEKEIANKKTKGAIYLNIFNTEEVDRYDKKFKEGTFFATLKKDVKFRLSLDDIDDSLSTATIDRDTPISVIARTSRASQDPEFSKTETKKEEFFYVVTPSGIDGWIPREALNEDTLIRKGDDESSTDALAYLEKQNKKEVITPAPTAVAEAESPLYQEGKTFLNKKEYSQAVVKLSEVVKSEPGNGRARYDLGNAYLGLKNYPDAASNFSKAYELNPKLTNALYNFGYALKKNGNFDQAIKVFEEYLTKVPDDPDAYYGLAESFEAKGDKEAAANNYEQYAATEKRTDRKTWIDGARQKAANFRAVPRGGVAGLNGIADIDASGARF